MIFPNRLYMRRMKLDGSSLETLYVNGDPGLLGLDVDMRSD